MFEPFRLEPLPADRTRYTCSVCRRVTFAPPHLIAITCSHCGRVDLGTEIARQRWRTMLEVREARRLERVSVRRHGWGVLLALAVVALVALGMVLR
jgi:hypothetical protein